MDKQQIKARFFGTHIGANVLVFGGARVKNGTYTLNSVRSRSDVGIELYFDNIPHAGNGNFDTCKLILRPLSSITGKEVFEMFLFAGIYGIDVIRDADKIGVVGHAGNCAVIWIKTSPKPVGRFLEAWNNIQNHPQPDVFEYMIADWLRANNFHLPFMGLDPVEEGWAILEGNAQGT